MIFPPNLPGIEKEQKASPSQGSNARNGDAHAMKTLLNSNGGSNGEVNELSSLFSSQARQASMDLKIKPAIKETAEKYLEERLKQYRETKSVTQEQSGEENPQQGQNDQEHGEHESSGELAREVAEHILVSDKAHMDSGSAAEVRIKIKDTILKNAHVHMIRKTDCLEVKLISSDEQSIQTLIEAKDDLEKQLKKNHTGLIQIEIVHLRPMGDA